MLYAKLPIFQQPLRRCKIIRFCYIFQYPGQHAKSSNGRASTCPEERDIETLHYILGIHAVRVTFDEDGVIQEAERYDHEAGAFASDWKTALRVADHTDADKVEAWELELFCQTAKRRS